MMSKFKKLMAAALVLCLMLALLPVGVLAGDEAGTDESPSTGGAGTGDTAPIDPSSPSADSQDPNNVTYTIKVQNNKGYVPANGTVSIKIGDGEFAAYTSTPISATPGETVTVKAEGKSNNYGLAEISADKVVLSSSGDYYTFVMPASNVILTTVFQQYYSLSISNTQGGTLVGPEKAVYTSTVSIQATPDDGYYLSKVWVEGTTENNKLEATINGNIATFKMPEEDVTITAEFEPKPVLPPVATYNVECIVPSGHGRLTADKTSYEENATVTLTVTPDKGYTLDELYYVEKNWPYPSYDLKSLSNPNFTMPAYDVVVVATFKPIEDCKFDISVETDTHCQAKYQSTAEPGEWVEVCIDNFDPGYHLYSVTFNDDLVTDDVYWYNGHWHYSFRMPWHDVDIYVATTNKLFVNTVYDINGGAVEVWVKDADGWGSTIFADADDWVCFKATPKSGYEVGDISVTGRWSGKAYDAYYNRYDGRYYFKMPYESVNLSVSFIDNSHKVTVKDVTNGSLKANTKWAVEGERVYITAVPDKGYELTWLYVKAADGSSVKVYEAIKEDTYYFFMPDQEVTVSAIFAYDYPDMPFIDVNPNSWYYSAIEFVYNKGIMNGVTASSFNPDGTITRGMIVTMLWRMAGEPSAVSAGFADVAADSYYAKAIAWAAKNGIIEGYSASSFGPNDAITREQLATVLYRYAKYLGYTTTGSSLSGYYDASRVSSWAKDAMGWAVKNGVVTGLSSTWLNPNGTASRAEAAQMFMNFYEFLG